MNCLFKFVLFISVLLHLSIVSKALNRCKAWRSNEAGDGNELIEGFCALRRLCFPERGWMIKPEVDFFNTTCPEVYFLIEVKLKKRTRFVVYLQRVRYLIIRILLVEQRMVKHVDRSAPDTKGVTLYVVVEEPDS
jgi:hypothetical protein